MQDYVSFYSPFVYINLVRDPGFSAKKRPALQCFELGKKSWVVSDGIHAVLGQKSRYFVNIQD